MYAMAVNAAPNAARTIHDAAAGASELSASADGAAMA